MIQIRRSSFLLLFVVALLFLVGGGCAKTSATATPAAPSPPQVVVAQAVDALAQAVDGAVTAAITARDQGKVSPADIAAIEDYAGAVARTGKAVNAELRSSDSWATQKTKILQTVSSAGLATLSGKLSPAGQVLVASLVALVNQISSAVGGPTL